MLMGLAAKNAILIVEFAKDETDAASMSSKPRCTQLDCASARVLIDLVRIHIGHTPNGACLRTGSASRKAIRYRVCSSECWLPSS